MPLNAKNPSIGPSLSVRYLYTPSQNKYFVKRNTLLLNGVDLPSFPFNSSCPTWRVKTINFFLISTVRWFFKVRLYIFLLNIPKVCRCRFHQIQCIPQIHIRCSGHLTFRSRISEKIFEGIRNFPH